MRIALLGTDNTHGHQFAGFINGWALDVPIPVASKHGLLPQFYLWAKALREAEHEPGMPVPSPDVRVTSIWCPDRDGAALVARACGIERHTDTPEEALDGADAVLVLTEDPQTHYDLAKPALERGLPTFVDKPLTPDAETNRLLASTAESSGAPWFSGSAFRFSPSLRRFRQSLPETAGDIQAVYVSIPGPLSYYGIHALEIANQLVPLDAVTGVQGFATKGRGGALLTLDSTVSVVIDCIEVPAEPPGSAIVYGSRQTQRWRSDDTYLAIMGMVQAFVTMTLTRKPPVAPEESLALAGLALEVTHAVAGITHTW